MTCRLPAYDVCVLTAVSLGVVEVDSDSDLLSMRSLVNQLIQVFGRLRVVIYTKKCRQL